MSPESGPVLKCFTCHTPTACCEGWTVVIPILRTGKLTSECPRSQRRSGGLSTQSMLLVTAQAFSRHPEVYQLVSAFICLTRASGVPRWPDPRLGSPPGAGRGPVLPCTRHPCPCSVGAGAQDTATTPDAPRPHVLPQARRKQH